MNITCDYCGQSAELVTGDVIYTGRADLGSKNFWRCVPCGAWVGCHPPANRHGGGIGDGTVPMGRLANAQLRSAKSRAHAAFDPLWQDGTHFTRTEAYAWLSLVLDIRPEDCHIGMFDLAMCMATISAANTFMQALDHASSR